MSLARRQCDARDGRMSPWTWLRLLLLYQTSKPIKAAQRMHVIMIQISEQIQLVKGALTGLGVGQDREREKP